MNVETKLARFVRLFPSVILILVVGAGAITADEPGTQVREYSQIETVPDGTGQKEVIVNYVTMEQSETIAVPATRRGNATIPPGVDSRDILVDYEAIARIHSTFGTASNAISTGIFATYEEQLATRCCDFSIASGRPFTGQIWIRNEDLVAHDMAFLCLMDYVQIPCTPNAADVQLREFAAEEEILSPIEIPDLGKGLHDFAVLVIHEPYQDIDAPDLGDRSETGRAMLLSALFVGDSTKAPEVDPVFPEPGPLLEGYGSLFFISKRAELVEPHGGILIWLSESSNSGEMIDFYLHFNDQDDPRTRRRMMAVMAFLNYEQVPIYINGQEHLPLYVQREPDTWQPLAVQIQAPSQPGVYEMLVVVRDYAHSRLTDEEHYFGPASTEHSQLIKLEVKPVP